MNYRGERNAGTICSDSASFIHGLRVFWHGLKRGAQIVALDPPSLSVPPCSLGLHEGPSNHLTDHSSRRGSRTSHTLRVNVPRNWHRLPVIVAHPAYSLLLSLSLTVRPRFPRYSRTLTRVRARVYMCVYLHVAGGIDI